MYPVDFSCCPILFLFFYSIFVLHICFPLILQDIVFDLIDRLLPFDHRYKVLTTLFPDDSHRYIHSCIIISHHPLLRPCSYLFLILKTCFSCKVRRMQIPAALARGIFILSFSPQRISPDCLLFFFFFILVFIFFLTLLFCCGNLL